MAKPFLARQESSEPESSDCYAPSDSYTSVNRTPSYVPRFHVEANPTSKTVDKYAHREESEGKIKGILGNKTEDDVVSTDFVGDNR
ncbi:unnamed protein product [Brassica napus]|uniref:(rape) hypothetical protein n=1 Tax=Brassica napus TaxID=3708 RepID=A0A816UIK8_BRANA|nr:unnamed protein product [Brassica napus]